MFTLISNLLELTNPILHNGSTNYDSFARTSVTTVGYSTKVLWQEVYYETIFFHCKPRKADSAWDGMNASDWRTRGPLRVEGGQPTRYGLKSEQMRRDRYVENL
jgi:hypothetical protein